MYLCACRIVSTKKHGSPSLLVERVWFNGQHQVPWVPKREFISQGPWVRLGTIYPSSPTLCNLAL